MKKITQDVLRVILYLAIYIVYQSLFVMGFALVACAFLCYRDGIIYDPSTLPDSYLIWSMALGMCAAALVGIYTYLRMKAVRFRKNFFISVPGRALLYSVGLIFFSIFALNIAVSCLNLPDNLAAEFDGLSHNIVGILTISVFVPILEEVLFRGAIQGRLMRRYSSPWVGITVAALIFGIIHMNPVQTVYATLLGLVFGWIYYRTRSLLPVILGHVLNNSFATFTMLLAGNESAESSAEPSIWVNLVLFLILGSIAVYLAYLMHRMLPSVSEPWLEVGENSGEMEQAAQEEDEEELETESELIDAEGEPVDGEDAQTAAEASEPEAEPEQAEASEHEIGAAGDAEV